LRKALLAAVGVVAGLVLAAGVVYAVPTLRDEAHWRWTLIRDSESAYAGYVREWPRGRHAADATRRLDAARWETAVAADSIPAFERYLQLHPAGERTADARERIDLLRWREARSTDTIQAYRQYLATNRGGAYSGRARTRIRELRWRLAARQLAGLACAGKRRVVLHRAPSLLSALFATFPDSDFIPYRLTLAAAPGKGYQKLGPEPCREFTVLGAAHTDYDDNSLADGRWIFVEADRAANRRGWVYVKGNLDDAAPPNVDWSVVPRVATDVLLPRGKGRPDLAFSGLEAVSQVGEECGRIGEIFVADFRAVLHNRGTGPAPRKTRVLVDAPSHRVIVEGRQLSTKRVMTFHFTRPFMPGESVVVTGIPDQSTLALDPAGSVAESDEGNNRLSVGQGGLFRCVARG
jgi:hypothetical protein